MEGWKEITLDNACLIKKGVQFNKTELEDSGSYPCINGGLQPSGYSEKWNTEADTITISEGGESCGYVNRISSRFWCGGHCYSLLQINEKINKDFFYFALKCRENSIMDLRVGSGLPNIQQKALKAFDFIYPISDIEQKKIAQILTALDDTIKQNEQLIAKYKNIKQGLMHDLLNYGIDENGTIRNPQTHTFVEKKGLMVPEEWEVEEIGSGIVKITTGSANTQDKVNDGVYPLFVRSTTIERSSKYIFDGEAVLTSGDGVGVGKIYHYFNGKFNYHQRVYCIYDFEKDRLFGKYFFEYFKSNFYVEISRQSAKTTVDSVRLAMITKMLIKLPLFNEQKKIVSILEQQDKLIESEQTNLAKLQKLKQGLMADLLTGKVRVKTESI